MVFDASPYQLAPDGELKSSLRKWSVVAMAVVWFAMVLILGCRLETRYVLGARIGLGVTPHYAPACFWCRHFVALS